MFSFKRLFFISNQALNGDTVAVLRRLPAASIGMNGYRSRVKNLVNAEGDSMGGFGEGGVGGRTSPHRAAIEKAQVELRQEYDVREERRRELEFLEKGGNPLDFKFVHPSCVSVQSTSFAGQLPEQFVTSEARGSFTSASPLGDSVESCDRPGAPSISEHNTADNLLLFDGEVSRDSPKSFLHSSRSNLFSGKAADDTGIFPLVKNQAYTRRNRSKFNRDGIRSTSGGHGVPSGRQGSKDVKSSVFDQNLKDQKTSSFRFAISGSHHHDVPARAIESDNQLGKEMGHILPNAFERKLVVAPSSDLQHEHKKLQDEQEPHDDMASGRADVDGGTKRELSIGVESHPSYAIVNVMNEANTGLQNGLLDSKLARKRNRAGVHSSNAVLGAKGLDSESSCSQTSLSLDQNNDSCFGPNSMNAIRERNTKEDAVASGQSPVFEGDEVMGERNEGMALGVRPVVDNSRDCILQNSSGNHHSGMVDDELHVDRNESNEDVETYDTDEGHKVNRNTKLKDGSAISKDNAVSGNLALDRDRLNLIRQDSCAVMSPPASISGTIVTSSSCRAPYSPLEFRASSENHVRLPDEVNEDAILEEARIIQAKHKRIAELYVTASPVEACRMSHWGFVLEEMEWLANDFVQERIWKKTASLQIASQAAIAARFRVEKQGLFRRQRRIAHNLALAVMEFWHSAQVLVVCSTEENGAENCTSGVPRCKKTSKDADVQSPKRLPASAIHSYAIRFLKDAEFCQKAQADTPETLDWKTGDDFTEMSHEDQQLKDNLFYTVIPGAIETYRRSIESHVLRSQKGYRGIQEEVDTSLYYTGAEPGSQDNIFDDDEKEAFMYYIPKSGGRKPRKFIQMKKKSLMKSYTSQPCGPVMLGPNSENNINTGSIPTKRIRTGNRQRILGPLSVVSSFVQAPARTGSSGETSSFQDDQSSHHAGSFTHTSLEIDSPNDHEMQPPFEYPEISKPRKKKKTRHLGATNDHRWQIDSGISIDQRGFLKKRLDSLHFESNVTNGLSQQNTKRPRVIKPSLDTSFDGSVMGSIPSPAASQMSNMSNSDHFMKIVGGRDRSRKAKLLKVSAGQSGSRKSWSLFEDQALVVLVHDMGPNWELVSDCINTSLQLKCIFRKPDECKERHKVLMDRTGDGADSAEDSGSSQAYPSTLPGIPRGSARQLFQRLQGPLEEDNLKSRFEKIISIVQRRNYQKAQNERHERRERAPIHSSHMLVLSQIHQNNTNGPPPTPLDLIDTASLTTDAIPVGYQVSHSSGQAIPSQGPVSSAVPASGSSTSVQGSVSGNVGNKLSTSPGSLNGPARDGRCSVSTSNSSPLNEQQRTQHYNLTVPGGSIHQSGQTITGSVSGPNPGIRAPSSGNCINTIRGTNRGIPIPRSGTQAVASSGIINSAGMRSSGMAGMASSVNVDSASGFVEENSILRSREASHVIRPGQSEDHQRRSVIPEHQIRGAQGPTPAAPPFGGLSSSNQLIPSPVQSFPGHPQKQQQISMQHSHAVGNLHHSHTQGPKPTASAQQQAMVFRLARERQLQQKLLQHQQQQHQFTASHMHPQSQIPISSSLQSSNQHQPFSLPQPPSVVPLSQSPVPVSAQHQQNHYIPPQALGQNPQISSGVLANQTGKQRQRHMQHQQQFQHTSRQPQQRQVCHQLVRHMEIGRGSMLVPQNHPISTTCLNGVTVPLGNQHADRNEQVVRLMHNQGIYSSVAPQSSSQCHPQQKLSSSLPPSSKVLHMPVSDVQVPPDPSGNMMPACQQSVAATVLAPNNHRLPMQPHSLRHINQSHSVQNRWEDTDLPSASGQALVHQPESCNESSLDPTVSLSTTSDWKPSEPFYEAGSVHNPRVASGEPLPSLGQTLLRRQFSDCSSPREHKNTPQWQQHYSQPSSPRSSSLYQQQEEQHLASQQYSQQQRKHSGVSSQNCLHTRSANDREG